MNREIFTMPSAQDVPLDPRDADEIELQESVRGVRSLVREMLLTEAAYTPEAAASEGLRFEVSKTKWGKGGWNVKCLSDSPDVRDPLMGQISISVPLGMGECLGAYEVTKSEAGFDGLGPLLYDIAMELAGPAGLMSDRRMVSPDARRVWDFYLNNRSEVERQQLDDPFGSITATDVTDDCAQDSAYDPGSPKVPPWLGAGGRGRNLTFKKSSLSKVYRKRGTPTIDRLRALGIIEIG